MQVKEQVPVNYKDTCMRDRTPRVHGLNEGLAAWERAVRNIPGAYVIGEQLIAQAKIPSGASLLRGHVGRTSFFFSICNCTLL